MPIGLLLAVCLSGPRVLFGDPNAYDPAQQGEHVDVSVVPVAAYSADDGVGGGVLFGFYWRRPDLRPYKFAVQGLLYATNLQVHADGLYFDWLRINGLPLRLIGGGIFWATLDDTYCGLGNNVTCSPAVAQRAADALNIRSSPSRETFLRTYYYRRYLNPAAELKLFWQLSDDDPKLELIASWRGSVYIPGVIGHLTPYAHNYYAQVHPDGEPGFASVLQLGFMMDARDKEAAPTHGYWFDASLRAAHPAWGSTWTYAGANATLRTYLPFDTHRTVVWANRLVADFVFGTPSVAELSQIGCYSVVPGGLQGYGGPDIGRGIRQNRYLGRIRVMDTSEMRWLFLSFDLLAQHFDLTAVGFAEAAWVAVDYHNMGGDPRKIILSEGVGVRIAWDEDFLIRGDLGVSNVENFDLKFYVSVNNLF